MSFPDANIAAGYLRAYVCSNYCNAVAATLLVYDYALTFRDEVQLFWDRQRLRSAILFVASRLVLLALAFAYVISSIPATNATLHSCQSAAIAAGIIEAFVLAIIAAVSALRVHVVTSGNWVLTLLTISLGLVPAIANIVISFVVPYASMRISGLDICVGGADESRITPLDKRVEIATRVCSIASDIVVLGAIWYHLYNAGAKCFRLKERRQFIISCILYDGTVYFLATLIMNVVNLMVWFYARWTSIDMVIVPVSATLISRSVINLRQVAYHRTMPYGSAFETSSLSQPRGLSASTAELSTVVFAREEEPVMLHPVQPSPHLSDCSSISSAFDEVGNEPVNNCRDESSSQHLHGHV